MICSSFGTATAMRAVAWKGIEVIATLVVVLICVERLDVANAGPRCTSPGRVDRGLLSPQDISDVTNVFKSLINAENAKDPVMVDRLIWNSPSTLLVDKLEKVSQGQWPGAWGYEAVRQRLHGVIAADFRIDPDYPNLKVVRLTDHAVEAYAPVEITAGGPDHDSKTYPVLMIVDWVKAPPGWRMASNVAIPIPQAATP